jgi:hypothetical protein
MSKDNHEFVQAERFISKHSRASNVCFIFLVLMNQSLTPCKFLV